MNMQYHRQQAESITNDPWWILFCIIVAIALALAGLPWIVIGFITQYYLARWLHWRLSFLLWFILLYVAAFTIYNSYQHGLQPLWDRELTDYFQAGMHYQLHILSYPFRKLWSETWPVWLYTWPGISIAGFVAELMANRTDRLRNLRQSEQHRQRRAQRSQNRARRRTNRPTLIPDETGGSMVIGVPIHDDNEETWHG
jgi:hypothetical protein